MIPVLLMLVYPGPAHARPAGAPEQRASDTDRDIAADILCAAVGDGRLTLDELDERLGAALSAQTTIELAALIADLPGRRCAPPPTRPSDPAGQARLQLPGPEPVVGHPGTGRRPHGLNLSHNVEGARLLGTLPQGVWGAAPPIRGGCRGVVPPDKHCAVGHGGAVGSMRALHGAITSAA